MITVINLKKCLGMEDDGQEGLFIITNFNKLDVAFHVDQVVGIHRVSWNEIIKPDSTINGEDGSVATGVIKMDGKLVVILDFEAIVSSSVRKPVSGSMILNRSGREAGARIQF